MKQTTKYKRISVPKQTISLLATQFGVSLVMVYNALAGRSNSDNAKKIRQSALEDYGGNISKVADAFKVSRTAVYKWIDGVPGFEDIVADARMRLFDECLSTARVAANGIPQIEGGRMVGWAERPDSNMLRYLLSTLGRKEGFGETISIETQIKTDYAELERLLSVAPDDVVEKIAARGAHLNKANKDLQDDGQA